MPLGQQPVAQRPVALALGLDVALVLVAQDDADGARAFGAVFFNADGELGVVQAVVTKIEL